MDRLYSSFAMAAISPLERAAVEALQNSEKEEVWTPTDIEQEPPTCFLTGLAMFRWCMTSRLCWWRLPDNVLFFKLMTFMETPTEPEGAWHSFVPMSFDMCGVLKPKEIQLSKDAESMVE